MALSDLLAPSLQIGSTILSAGSQLARGSAARTVASRRKAVGEYEAQQLEQEAAQSRGVGMRGAQDEALKAQLVNSSALARAAASGAGASDPTVLAILARTSGEGAYRQAVAMYEGEAQARLDLMKASALRTEGNISESDAMASERASKTGAVATALSGGARTLSMYDKYWAGRPKPSSASFDSGTAFDTSSALDLG